MQRMLRQVFPHKSLQVLDQAHRVQALSAEQIKVLNRLLDGGERGFEDGISAAQYQAVAKVPKATAICHLSDLLGKGCIVRLRAVGGAPFIRLIGTPRI